MAQLPKIRRSTPISNFQRVTPQAGTGFAALAEIANEAYDFFAKGAKEKMRQTGLEAGHEWSRRVMGDNRMPLPEIETPGREGLSTVGVGVGIGDGTFRDAVGFVESGNRYDAVGPETSNGGRAYGRYQVMDFNVGPWTEEVLGRRMTPQEFLSDPEAQDAVFDAKFGAAYEQHGSLADAASVWFSGRPLSAAGSASDGYNTVPEYVAKVTGRYNSAISASDDGTLTGGGFDSPDKIAADAMSELGVNVEVQPTPGAVGMIGGVKGNGEVWQSFDGDGTAHDPSYRDYSQLYREYRFDPPDDTWVPVGERNGRTVYAAPDYARDENGNYLSVSAAEAQQLAQERGGVVPTRDEVKALYDNAEQITMPTSGDFGKEGGEGTSEEYTAAVDSRRQEAGVPDGAPVVHGKEFFAHDDIPLEEIVVTPQDNGEPRVSSRGTVEPATTVRTREGKIEPRLYSPLSGEILQAHNAAAGVAFLADTKLAAATDMMALSFENEGNPDGFMEAAEAYVESLVERAPDMFKGDLRNELTEEVQRRYLGMVDERHKEIRTRASNSSKALIDRYRMEYAESQAAGRTEEAAAARARLEDALLARESLPGVAWTRAQSENTILAALDDADRLRARRDKERSDEIGDRLDLAITARKGGRVAEGEDIIDDPAVWQMHPDKAQELAARIAAADVYPDFMALPPAQQQAVMAEEKARPVGAKYEMDFLSALQDLHKTTLAALGDDPVKFAAENLQNDTEIGPPPQIDFAAVATDPTGFAKSLRARSQWAERFQAAGYVEGLVPLSKDEAKMLSAALKPDQDPAGRAMLVGMIAQTAPEALPAMLQQAGADDVLVHGGGLAAVTGNVGLLEEAIRGQELVAAGQVQFPQGASKMGVVAPAVAEAMAGLPDAGNMQKRVMKFAQALYATQAGGVQTDEDRKELMAEAVNRALGQETLPKGVAGGVQDVNGFETLLPTGMTVKEFNQAVFGVGEVSGFGPVVGVGKAGPMIGFSTGTGVEFDADRWKAASRDESLPTFRGTPLDEKAFSDPDRMRFVATGGGFYRIQYQTGMGFVDVMNDDGVSIFEFDIRKLAGG
ncbi:hypothetical protein [Roseovarius amoyensis]|uniref:hypothetical protein n=1 Tax=Roseovarius amoyensis TaxID=2211448 RepID=UPI000DBE2B89|nr:hypothetical protein [Roseovarius amoyensis]